MQIAARRDLPALAFGSLTNAVEWYDFALFGALAPEIGFVFFPGRSRSMRLMKSFGVFAAAFFARPVGALVFGSIGDSLGRKTALYASVMLMASATFAVGLLPSYDQVGVVSPYLLIVCRVCQGLSAGGQVAGAMLLSTEGMPENRRVLYYSFNMITGTLAAAGATLMVALMRELLGKPLMQAWAWRLPFLGGVFSAACATLTRHSVEESAEFRRASKVSGTNLENQELLAGSLALVCSRLRKHPGTVLKLALLIGCGGSTWYNTAVWLPAYLSQQREPPVRCAYELIACLSLAVCPLVPALAWVADNFGYSRLLAAGLGSVAVLVLPTFALAATASPVYVGCLVGSLLIAHNAWNCTLGGYLPTLVPAEERYTVLAIGYNLGQCLLGGCLPLASTALVHQFGTPLAAGGLQLAVVLATLPVALCLAEADSGDPRGQHASYAPVAASEEAAAKAEGMLLEGI